MPQHEYHRQRHPEPLARLRPAGRRDVARRDRATTLDLFCDLVYAFAFTKLDDRVLAHLQVVLGMKLR